MKPFLMIWAWGCLLFFSNPVCFSQGKSEFWKGTVLDSLTKEPVPFANVFFANTTIGTTTNEKGEFTILKAPGVLMELVISHLNYEIRRIWIGQKTDGSKLLLMLMTPKVLDINEVAVYGRIDPSRKYYLRLFDQYFLGDLKRFTCVLENPESLIFEKKGTKIWTTCLEPLRIRNTHLGYKITYYLDYFLFNDSEVFDPTIENQAFYTYQGVARFEEIQTPEVEMQDLWERNRAKAYSGSLGNFLSCLFTDQLSRNKYTVLRPGIPLDLPPGIVTDSVFYFDERTGNSGYLFYAYYQPVDLFKHTVTLNSHGLRRLMFPDSLLIFRDVKKTKFDLWDDETTLFVMDKSHLEFDIDGNYQVYNGDVLWSLLDSKKKIIRMLPLDYSPLRKIKSTK